MSVKFTPSAERKKPFTLAFTLLKVAYTTPFGRTATSLKYALLLLFPNTIAHDLPVSVLRQMAPYVAIYKQVATVSTGEATMRQPP